jgi:hypothetical protein
MVEGLLIREITVNTFFIKQEAETPVDRYLKMHHKASIKSPLTVKMNQTVNDFVEYSV